MPAKILDIGQCDLDGPRMARLWRDRLGATVDRLASGGDAVRQCSQTQYDLILVNRVLAADGTSGLDVIRDLVEAGVAAPVMLVSNYAAAQDQAVAMGAVRGFGKASLDDESTIDLIRQAMSVEENPKA